MVHPADAAFTAQTQEVGATRWLSLNGNREGVLCRVWGCGCGMMREGGSCFGAPFIKSFGRLEASSKHHVVNEFSPPGGMKSARFIGGVCLGLSE